MTLVRCAACRGRKNIMGMGMTVKKCSTCDGIGYNKELPQDIKKDEIVSLDEVVKKIQVDMVNDKQEAKHARKAAQKEKSS